MWYNNNLFFRIKSIFNNYNKMACTSNFAWSQIYHNGVKVDFPTEKFAQDTWEYNNSQKEDFGL